MLAAALIFVAGAVCCVTLVDNFWKNLGGVQILLDICPFPLISAHWQNLSYGKNYFTASYLFSGPASATKAAAWISMAMIVLMLVLTVTSVKAVRRKFSAKRWKALQRWAYLFYGLIYVHVLLMNVPGFLNGRTRCGWTLLAYSVVFLSYAVCRIRKALLMRRGQPAKLTETSQLAAAGIGVAASLILVAGLYLSIPKAVPATAAPQDPEPIRQIAQDQAKNLAPEPESYLEPAPEPEKDASSDTDTVEPDDAPTEDIAPEQAQKPYEGPKAIPAPAAESDSEPSQESEPKPEVPSTQEPEPEAEASPAPASEPEPEPALKYQNGTFTGSGEGYYGMVTVSVTISDDVIVSISIDSYIDDDDYFDDAKSGVIPAILTAQSPGVSAVSGATYSSKGLMAAVQDALAKAEN